MLRRILLLLLVLLLLAPIELRAQEPSLADVARTTRTAKEAAAKIITNEELRGESSEIPDIAFDGVDNSDEIVRAIVAYGRAHTREQTSAAVHAWYDKHDGLMEKAIRENQEIKQRREQRSYSGTLDRAPDNAKQYQERWQSEMEQARADRETERTNGLRQARIQQELQKVRLAVLRFGLPCDYMKIRFGNGNGSW